MNNLEHGWSRIGPTGQDYLDWKEESKSFDDMFLFEHGTGTVTGLGEPEQVAGFRVTTNFGDFFAIKPVVGRTFRLEEAGGRRNFAILGYGYWQRRFGSDPGVTGRGMTLNGEEYTIIGILPANFAALFPADVVVPFDNDWVKRSDSDLGVFGRLKPGRGGSAGPRRHRTRATLVVVESALAFVLVIGVGLMIRSFWHLLGATPGFHPDHLLTLRIKLPTDAKNSAYREPRQQATTFARFLASVEAVPGIQSAAFTEIVPLSQDDMDMGYFNIKEEPPLSAGEHLAADYRDVTPNYFATMGIPLVGGRTFSEQDNLARPRVVVIDESLARRFFPNQDPLGKHLQVPDATKPAREIVGVVGGVRDTGFNQPPRPTIFFPSLRAPTRP